ncbi:MAG: 4-oxalocrotonate tautomerase [Candidatus Dormibacteraeota bacterium]|nr:4-oxalocrotonate tautomerase [Candidatus Dormibacteraeota bacterium]
MPMIDVYAAEGTFPAKKELTSALTAAMMRWEGVPPISLFKDNTAAFIHDLEPDALANANGESNHVRVQILTPIGVLDRDKQVGVVREMTDIVASAAGDPSLVDRTWVLIHESPDGGWGIDGQALTNADIAAAARHELSSR